MDLQIGNLYKNPAIYRPAVRKRFQVMRSVEPLVGTVCSPIPPSCSPCYLLGALRIAVQARYVEQHRLVRGTDWCTT